MTSTLEHAGPKITLSPEPIEKSENPAAYGQHVGPSYDDATPQGAPGSSAPSAQSLPTELLYHIFLLCKGQYPADKPHPNHPPLIFGRVCAQWRRIAYSSPGLWTNLNFDLAGPGRLDERISLAEAWLARASPLPLSVSYTIPRKLSWNTGARGLLSSFIHQTTHLALDLPFRLLHPLANLPPGAMSLLEVLELRNLEHPLDLPFWEAQPINFSGACRLYSVTMTCLGIRSLQSVSNIPWSQLSYLSLINCMAPVYQAREILTCSPNLVSLLFDFASSGSLVGDFHPPFPLTHHKLCHCVISTHGRRITEFFQCLALPELNSLGIIYNGSQILSNEVVLPALTNLQRRSLFSLTSLAFRQMHLPFQQLIQLLRDTPEISDLRLDGCCCLDHHLVNHLHFDPLDPSPLLPALQKLYVSDTHTIDDNDILAMLESRRFHSNRSPARLTDVTVSLTDTQIQNPSSNGRLERLRTDGLHVEVLRPNRSLSPKPTSTMAWYHSVDDFHKLWNASLGSRAPYQ
ncbi:hypothetical protein BD779DRAFT_1475472 [Infundibulicybe gibba]|nr:hypothetical protein BD779DRAFT_1475472 [Infundibulicybe gibba]